MMKWITIETKKITKSRQLVSEIVVAVVGWAREKRCCLALEIERSGTFRMGKIATKREENRKEKNNEMKGNFQR